MLKYENLKEVIEKFEKSYGKLKSITLDFEEATITLKEVGDGLNVEIEL